MISDETMKTLCSKLVPLNYLNIASDARKQREKIIQQLFEKRKIPESGFDDIVIETLVTEISQLDSNNFPSKCGVGEREARIACDLVRRRHYGLGHGVGRSGDICENQPKAAGSSILNQLTNILTLDLIKMMGIRSIEKSILLPMATGMSLMLCFLTLKSQRSSEAKYVLWSRIDQKSCFKCITTANLIPVIINPIRNEDELQTNLTEFENQIKILGEDKIVCIVSTTSCFAPRGCDDIEGLAVLAKKHNIPHVINNAYGLQTTFLTHQIEQGIKEGNVDIFVQSTDKNLLVPVGGAIIAGPHKKLIDDIAKHYAGRGSSSQTLDVFMTILSLGRDGYMKLVRDRKENFNYLKERFEILAEKHKENILNTKRNPISIAMTLKNFDENNVSMIGSMLFTRGVSGCRVITTKDDKAIDGYLFQGWGSHVTDLINNTPYITAAASIGITKIDIDAFIDKLDKVLLKVRNNKES
ncbi:CLUMA_CG012475, isoform A [Clunio marinus]|uniref:O-phosphoseryl-tRNA(Sec) selenium transferase n=1 Tax=Clunio marinus TaxID=568069 RepID=A0A1J1IFX1_9DIPT|nr:CLUMA_CG012475, isoform A [Clunio marinus]